MKAVGGIQRRSKVFSLEAFERRLGKVKLAELTRERLVEFGRDRAKGAVPLLQKERPIFPCDGRSIGTAFRRACRALNIEDLHFRDLRHEGASRLFDAGFPIEKLALVWAQAARTKANLPQAAEAISPSFFMPHSPKLRPPIVRRV